MQASISNKIVPCGSNDVSLDNKHGNCRCCLSISEYTRLLEESLLQMFQDNLNVVLSPDSRLPQIICTDCYQTLNIVDSFRKKVLASEKTLIKIVGATQEADNKDPLSTAGEVTIKQEEEDDFFNQEALSETPELECLQEITEPKMKTENADKDIKIKVELRQTKPIKLSTTRSKEVTKSQRKRKKCIQNDDEDNYDDTTYVTVGGKEELANEATKIRANISTLLQNSTATPFRTKSNAFQCFYCENKYGVFEKLKQHTTNDHETDKNERKIFDYLRRAYKTTVHADITDLKCKNCWQNVDCIDDLVQHLKNHENIIHNVKDDSKVPSHGVLAYKVDMEGFLCHICLTPFRFLKFLISHMQEHYAIYSCTECVKKFLTKERLREHLKEHELKETKCTDCHLTFETRRLMLNHRYAKHIKTKKSLLKCPECPKTFAVSKPLVRFLHMESAHNIKRPEYTCEFCNKSYKTIYSLGSHKRHVHVKRNKYICDVCGYLTTDKSIMDKHLDHHKGTRDFECDICHKKFRTKGNLRLHLRGHYNDKRFACSLCDAAFIQKHCLKSHVKSRHSDSVDVNQLLST